MLLLGFCGLALSFFVTAMATAIWMLIVVRAVQRRDAVERAGRQRLRRRHHRARPSARKRFGLLGAMFGLGFILGPVIGGLLGAIDLRLPFFAAGSAGAAQPAVRLVRAARIAAAPSGAARSPGARAQSDRCARRARPLGGVGVLVAVVACTALSQFVLYTSWVLYTTFKFGWGPQRERLVAVHRRLMSALVQGVLLGRLLKRFSPQRLAIVGLVSSTLAYVGWGAATEGWMMYAVIVCNVLGFTVAASMQSIISGAADAHDARPHDGRRQLRCRA